MLKWVSRSSHLESDKPLQTCPESPSQFPPSYRDSPELFFSPREDLSSDSPVRSAPVFQLSSSASLDSLRPQSPGEPGDESHCEDLCSLCSLMLSLPCLLQVPLMTAQRGGLAFLLVYSLALLLLVWPSLHLQAWLHILPFNIKIFYGVLV